MRKLYSVKDVCDQSNIKVDLVCIKLGYYLAMTAREGMAVRTKLSIKDFYARIKDAEISIYFDEHGRIQQANCFEPNASFKNRGRPSMNAVHRMTATVEKFLNYGQAMTALARSPQYLDKSIGSVHAMLVSTFNIQQNKVYFDQKGISSGFVSWAWVSQYTIQKLRATPISDIHSSEWNEGDALCFRDLVITKDNASSIAEDIGGMMFPEEPCFLTIRSIESGRAELFRVERSERKQLGDWIQRQAS
ncbi:toxin-activating lysine-acyltransferase [Paucibacter sp. KCTC 42545]|uniref:toxin-activating lysine-acyltransferase n=1 Tax=Paucibacter sp. KCTC 42545 TaxID=1768242 RepID=UPI0009EACDF1|nr:toxin-activating lysine-acyltransferase [Paucibacter sp. KCTC 42545]